MRRGFGPTVFFLSAALGLPNLINAESLTVTSESVDVVYVVKKGDFLSGIAAGSPFRETGTSWRQIFELNRDQIKDPNLIEPGMRLKAIEGPTGPSGTRTELEWIAGRGGDLVRAVSTTVNVLGGGPRSLEMEYTDSMRSSWVKIFDSHQHLVDSFEMHPMDDQRRTWRAEWWQDSSKYVSGSLYHVFIEAIDALGQPLAVPGKMTDRILLEDRLKPTSYGSSLLHFNSYRFDVRTPNPNLKAPWAERLVHEHSQLHSKP